MANIEDCISLLWNSRTQAQIWHNQTDSYSEHKALGRYYDEIGELTDGLVESIQGVYPRITGIKTLQVIDWSSREVTVAYFKNLYAYIQKELYGKYNETWIKNQVDGISELVASTLYQLSLK